MRQDERNAEICRQRAAGLTYRELARLHGLHPSRVEQIVKTHAREARRAARSWEIGARR